ncbi:hypothetical protein [Streptomyces brasiliscabiei]|uniref:hypothetical protein n=1 Tax=Streptomyces brasiliscabiei TaxID=2736302 RepID=UPI001C0FD0DB|nr:hypothetical protein [Streptomyces brasiliscabiei]
MRTRVTVLLATALLTTLAACTSDSEPGGADGTPSAGAGKPSGTPTPAETAAGIDAADRAALETAVREYTAAYFANRPDTAFGMLTARCQKQITRAGMAVLTERADQTRRAIGDTEPKEVKRFEVNETDGDEARVSYGVGTPKFDQKREQWAREAGVWRYDTC